MEKDSSGAFVTSLDVGRIEADSGATYGCQPSPGVDTEVKVHVIKEGIAVKKFDIQLMIFHRNNVNRSESKFNHHQRKVVHHPYPNRNVYLQ